MKAGKRVCEGRFEIARLLVQSAVTVGDIPIPCEAFYKTFKSILINSKNKLGAGVNRGPVSTRGDDVLMGKYCFSLVDVARLQRSN